MTKTEKMVKYCESKTETAATCNLFRRNDQEIFEQICSYVLEAMLVVLFSTQICAKKVHKT